MKRSLLIVIGLVIALCLAVLFSIGAGAVPITWPVILNTLLDLEGPKQGFIVMKSRVPRTVLAVLTGGSLALSGVIIQALLRNALASPKIIGINSGAALAVCMMVLVLPDVPLQFLPLAALCGALLAAALVYVGSRLRQGEPARLALIGIAIGFLFDAGVDYILVTSPPYQMSSPLVWLTGSLWARGWTHVQVVWPSLVVLAVIALLLFHRLNLIRLGDTVATGLGMSVWRERFILLAVATGLAALSVSVVGVLGFVGLMAPHLARSLVGGRHGILLPVSLLIGALLVVLADALGRMIMPPAEVSAGIVTALLGAPFFIYLLIKSGKATTI